MHSKMFEKVLYFVVQLSCTVVFYTVGAISVMLSVVSGDYRR